MEHSLVVCNRCRVDVISAYGAAIDPARSMAERKALYTRMVAYERKHETILASLKLDETRLVNMYAMHSIAFVSVAYALRRAETSMVKIYSGSKPALECGYDGVGYIVSISGNIMAYENYVSMVFDVLLDL